MKKAEDKLKLEAIKILSVDVTKEAYLVPLCPMFLREFSSCLLMNIGKECAFRIDSLRMYCLDLMELKPS